MQCDYYHPAPMPGRPDDHLGEKRPEPARQEDRRVLGLAASYSKPISVPQSLILQMPRFGLDVTLAHPPEFKLMPEIMDQAREQARKYNTGFEVVDSMEEGFKDADIVYAKSWGPLVTTDKPDEITKITQKYEKLDHRREKDGSFKRGFHLYAPPAGRPQY